MGNSNALPYDIGDAVDYTNNNFWQLSVGSKKVNCYILGIPFVATPNFFLIRKQNNQCQFSSLTNCKNMKELG
jgi:hypothetical protein